MVASDTGAFRMIVDEDKTGYVVPTGDANSLAQALEKYMSNPKEALLAGQLGRERVKTMFSVEKEAEGIRTVYNTVWKR
jgi:mannosyltransferase